MKRILFWVMAFCLIAFPAHGVKEYAKRFPTNTALEVFTKNNDMIPAADDTYDIGIASLQWQDLYLSGKAYFNAGLDYLTWDIQRTDFVLSDDLILENTHPGLWFLYPDKDSAFGLHYHPGSTYPFGLWRGTEDGTGVQVSPNMPVWWCEDDTTPLVTFPYGISADKLALPNGSEIGDDGGGYLELSGDGVPTTDGLAISIPQTAGDWFYYGYGGTEHHIFGPLGTLTEITDESDIIMQGDLEIDSDTKGLILGEVQDATLKWDDSEQDVDLNNDLNISDATPHLKLIDTDANQDDYEFYADDNQAYFTNVTDEVIIWKVKENNDFIVPVANVGIGTASPGETLEVAGNIAVTGKAGDDVYIFKDAGTGIRIRSDSLTTQWWAGDDGPAYFGTVSNDDFHIQTNNNTRITIKSGAGSGYVGIGVIDPDTKLEIFNAGTQLKLSFDATDFATFAVDTNHDLTITPSSTGQIILQPTTDSTDFFQVLDADGGTPILNVDSTNERVGIGTATPTATLHIVGVFRQTRNNVDWHLTPSSDGEAFAIAKTGVADYIICKDNKVGIGVQLPAVPDEQLSVVHSTGGRFIVSDSSGASRKVILMQSPGSANVYGKIDVFDYGASAGLDLILQGAGGRIGVGLVSPTGLFHIDQSSTTAAIPVVKLDQGDTSEPFIDFIGTATADANSSISTLDTSGAITDHIQIDLNGTKAWIAVSTNNPT